MNAPHAGSRSMPTPDVLEASLAQLAAGEDLDVVLTAYSGDRDALGALVQMARTVRESCAPPSSAFRAGLQVRLASLDLGPAPDPSVIPEPNEMPLDWPRLARPADGSPATRSGVSGERLADRGSRWRPWLSRLASSAIAISLFLAGVVAVSANSRPGDPLYPVKQAADQLGAALAQAVDAIFSDVGLRQPGDSSSSNPVDRAPSASSRPETSDGPAPSTRRYVAPPPGEETPVEVATLPATTSRDVALVRGATATTISRQDGPVTTTPTPATLRSGSKDVPPASPSPSASPVVPTELPPATATPAAAGRGPFVPGRPPSGPVGAIAGQVWGYDRQPRPKWPVSAYPVSSNEAEPFGPAPFKTKTAEDGSYRLDNLPPGRYKILVGQMWFYFGDVRWYPGTWSSKHAKVVVVAAQATTTGIDVRYERLGMTVPFRLAP